MAAVRGDGNGQAVMPGTTAPAPVELKISADVPRERKTDSVAIMGSQISQENSKDDCKTLVEPEQVRLGRQVEGESMMQVGCHSACILHHLLINMRV